MRAWDLPEEGEHVHVLDPPLAVRVVLRPGGDKLVEVVRAQDRPVARQVVKVVHDHGHKQVEDEERGHDEERCEVDIGNVAATPIWVVPLIAEQVRGDHDWSHLIGSHRVSGLLIQPIMMSCHTWAVIVQNLQERRKEQTNIRIFSFSFCQSP